MRIFGYVLECYGVGSVYIFLWGVCECGGREGVRQFCNNFYLVGRRYCGLVRLAKGRRP